MKIEFIRTGDGKQEVRRDGVLLGHVWKYGGRWSWRVRNGMLVGGDRATRTAAAERLGEDYDAAHPAAPESATTSPAHRRS